MAGQYDHIIRQYLEDGGVVVHLSGDTTFTRVLRSIISRDMGFKGEALFHFTSPNQAMEKCQQLRDDVIPAIIFVARMIEDRPTTDFIIALKREFPAIKIIVPTWEATQETVAYLFEMGVSRVLIKPASADKVIEELAHTINPPSELRRQMNRCRVLLEREDFDEALEVTDRILLLKPNSARGLTMRGDALMGIGETDKAVQSYMTAHESKPIFMAPLIKLAASFKDMEDERALEYMKTLDNISPLNPERKIDIAEQHLRRNETEVAEEYLDKGMEAAERETLSMVGDLTERIVDAVSPQAPALAIKYLNRVIDAKRVLGRDDLVHFNRLGIILRGEGKWNEAVEVYDKALLIVQDDPVVHYNKGLAYWEGNERTRAIQCFEKAMDLDPQFYAGSVGAALNIGSLYLDLRQFIDAEPFFEHVLDIDPDNKTAKKRLRDARKRVPPKHSREREASSQSTDSHYNMDALAGGSSSSAKPKASQGRSSKSESTFNVDKIFGDYGSDKSKKKKKTKKSVNLDF